VFHALLQSLTAEQARASSNNPGWTNGEILSHIAFGFVIVNVLLPLARMWGRLPPGSSRWFAGLLNAFTGPFNWMNALGARGQARIFTYARVGTVLDRAIAALERQLASIRDEEWGRGMYYPTKWDPNFGEFMTLRQLFHYPVAHFALHRDQIRLNADDVPD
jgi:hypothetical protein